MLKTNSRGPGLGRHGRNGSAVWAQNLEPWGASDFWDVMIDPTLGNGCLIQVQFEDGSVVRIGLDATNGTGYVTAFNESLGRYRGRCKLYPISFAWMARGFEGEAVRHVSGRDAGGGYRFRQRGFLHVHRPKRQTMTMYHDGAEVVD
jgi:hypothetical protein